MRNLYICYFMGIVIGLIGGYVLYPYLHPRPVGMIIAEPVTPDSSCRDDEESYVMDPNSGIGHWEICHDGQWQPETGEDNGPDNDPVRSKPHPGWSV